MFRLVSLLILFSATNLLAQIDAHYWTHQFGGRALLLNGAVIANTDDETAIFYNPGAMAMNEKDNIGVSLSFITPMRSRMDTKNYFGEGSTISDADWGFAPGLAALGINPFGKDSDFRMAFTSFTRYRSNVSFRYRTVLPVVGTEDQLYEANLKFRRSLSESWIGIGAGWRLFNVVGVGVAQFFTFHGQTSDLSVDQDILSRSNPETLLAAWHNREKYHFSLNGRMLTKFGLSIQAGQFKFGLTLTTPSVGGYSKKSEIEREELKKYLDGTTTLISNRAFGEVEEYKTPLSVGVGLEVPFYKSILSISGEYFWGIDDYTVFKISDDPYNGFSENPTPTEFKLQTGNREIFNIAIGLQAPVSEKSTIIIGFRTDFNQLPVRPDNGALQLLSNTPSVMHLSVGNVLEIWKSRFSFGIDYGIGIRNTFSPTIDVYSTNLDNLFDDPVERTVRWEFQSFVLILAYDFSGRKKKS